MFEHKTNRTLCVIPCYNEAVNLASLFSDIRTSKLAKVCDILFVDDCSQDETPSLITKEGFHLIQHSQNRGYGGAVRTGYDFAVSKGYENFILFPGDHQRKADDALLLIAMLEEQEVDVVVGNKFHIYLANGSPVRRRIGNIIFSRMAKHLWSSTVEDVLAGFKVYRISAVRPFFDFLPFGYPLDIVFSLYASRCGLKMREIPVACRYDQHTTKMRSVIGVSIQLMVYALVHYFFIYPYWFLVNSRRSSGLTSLETGILDPEGS